MSAAAILPLTVPPIATAVGVAGQPVGASNTRASGVAASGVAASGVGTIGASAAGRLASGRLTVGASGWGKTGASEKPSSPNGVAAVLKVQALASPANVKTARMRCTAAEYSKFAPPRRAQR